jgi:hypothetical protein
LVGDSGALALAGEASTSSLLVLAQGFVNETDFLVWSQVLGSLAIVKLAFSNDAAVTKGLQKYIVKLISPAVERIGWEPSPGEDILNSQLRSLLISTAGANGHEKYVPFHPCPKVSPNRMPESSQRLSAALTYTSVAKILPPLALVFAPLSTG